MTGEFLRAAWLLCCCGLAVAQPSSLVVKDAWVRAIPGASTAAAYFTLRNSGAIPITVIGVESSTVDHAMIHESSVEAGQSRMRPRKRLVIAAGQTVRLSPGGLHVMLEDLRQPLTAGQRVPLQILLSDGTRIEVEAVVHALGDE